MRPSRRPGHQAASRVRRAYSLRCISLCILLFSTAIGHSQSAADCALQGIVISPFGHAAAHALILLHSVDTGLERSVFSGDGTFLFPGLTPGEYILSASAPGFLSLHHASVTLALGEVTEVYVPLGLRALHENVDVQADADTSPLETTIHPTELDLLPIENRRWQDFALLAPQAAPDQDGDGLVSFRGLASTQNSLLVDGMDANQSFSSIPAGTGSDPVPDPDEETDRASAGSSLGLARGRGNGALTNFASGAVREFRVTGQSYSALTGHAAGGVVTAITRSGTSQIHGAASVLLRSSALAATNPLSLNTTYTDGIVSSSLVKPQDLRENFGGTIGGPVVPTRIPTHKLFYFYSFEGENRNFPAISSPAYANFYALTSTQTALLANRGVKPTAIVSALSYVSSLTGSVPRSSAETIQFGKLDWQLTGRNSFGLQYNRLRSDAPAGATSAPTVARGRASIGDAEVALDSFVPRLTSTFGSRLVNDLRLQISRDLQHQRPQLTLPQEPTIGPGGQSPEIDISPNGFLFGTPASLSHQAYPDERRDEVTDTVSLALGHHFLQLGGNLSLVHDRVATLPNAAGTFHYDSSLIDGHTGGLVDWITDYTFNIRAYPNGACPSITAKTHLFCFRSFTQSFGVQTVAFDTQEWAGFVQDQWHPQYNLTFTAGVRYEYELLPFPQQPNPSLDQIFGKIGASSVFPEDRNNAGPRAAISWEPWGPGRGLIRIGYGAFFGRLPGVTIRAALANTALPLSQQSGSTTHIRITPATNTACPQVANQGFGYPCAYTATPPAAVAATTSATVFDHHFRLPMIQQASLSLERELAHATTFSATYVMNLDRQLPNSTDLNIAPSTALKRFQLQGGSSTAGIVSGQTFAVPLYTARLTPLFGPITDILSNVSGTYNALAFTLTHASRRGLDLHANYTWSKAIDFGQSATGTPRTDAQFDPFNIRYDRAVSALNHPQSLTASAIWRPSAELGNRWLNYVANHWSLAPIVIARSGRPYSLQIFGGTELSGGRESINGSGGAVYLPTVGRNTLRLPPTVNVDLRLARTIGLSKGSSDHVRLRLTAEAFNLTNHVNISSVEQRALLAGTEANGLTPLIFQDAATIAAEGLNSQPFGTPTAAGTSLVRERQVQLGIRVEF